MYYKIIQNLENLKKDKIYIEKLILEIKYKYFESEEKNLKKYYDKDEFTFSDFNEYYNNEFLVNMNSLIKFIEILLPNYNPIKLKENLSLTLELFIYYRKISKFNFKDFEKINQNYYLYNYLEDYFNPFNINCHKLEINKIFHNKIKLEISKNEILYDFKVLKDGRIIGIIEEKKKKFNIN